MNDTRATAADHTLLSEYAPVSGVADELYDAAGQMRPAWRRFVERLARLGPEDLHARFERGNRYLREAGVYFRSYSGDPLDEREWPLSHIPVILDDAEWDGICAGLAERADLLEHVVRDIYGAATLVADGHLPAEIVAENPHWQRPMVGVEPPGGHYLHFLAFEIGRSPDGSWLVLGDRTQAPSGAGFALENRMATRRIFPETYPRLYTHRLAGFFEGFRDRLRDLARDANGNPRDFGLLTPGRANDTFFEHFYIARYLGVPLLEGEDVIVRNGEALLRTIEGPEPLGLLWRRIDADFADPLEFNPASSIGVPGMAQAVRGGKLALVNALGAGVLESRAMMAFLPRIARKVTGKPLSLPNIATWWCGGASERDYVRANLDRMIVTNTQSVDLPFEPQPGPSDPDGIAAALADPAAARHLVGQEAVTLSTTPRCAETEHGPRLRPCPMTIRVFAARTATGWSFLKGGYARVGPEGDATALAMQRGGSVADVWVVSDKPVPVPRPAPPPDANSLRLAAEYAALPTRAADNLFWLGRYLVRFEDTARLLRAYHLRQATTASEDDPLLAEIADALRPLGLDVQTPLPQALVAMLTNARGCAERVRDRFSIDGWSAIEDLVKTAHQLSPNLQSGDDAASAMGVFLRKASGVSGIVNDNMYRFSGWRFLSLGRAIERADMLAFVLERFAIGGSLRGTLDLAIEAGDGAMAHRRRYALDASEATVLELLALDPGNPRSLAFQIARLIELAGELPGATEAGRAGPVLRALLPLRTRFAVAAADDIDAAALRDTRQALASLSDSIAQRYLR